MMTEEQEQYKLVYDAYQKAQWIQGGCKNSVDYAYVEEGKKLIILFQASSGKMDWFCNLFFFPRRVTPYKNMPYPFKVHSGFWKQFDSVRDKILDDVKKKLTGDITEVIIYGWSLGGRLAMFCKEMLTFNFPSFPISCITIGAPRGFCKTEHWEDIKSRFDNCTRYQNGSDIATVSPFKCLGGSTPFTHEVEKTHVGDKFRVFKVVKTGKYHQQDAYYLSIMGAEPK